MIDADTAEPCKCQAQQKAERIFESSRITPAFKLKTFDNFERRSVAAGELFDCSREYAERFEAIRQKENNWLVFLGEPGCGKTHLSMAVANHLLNSGVQVLYFPHVEGINELRNAVTQEGELAEKLDRMKKVPVLIWDDMFKGREVPTDFVLEKMFEILNYRYLNLLPTVINSERFPEQLIEIDKAVGSRILERGRGRMVVVKGLGENYRLK